MFMAAHAFNVFSDVALRASRQIVEMNMKPSKFASNNRTEVRAQVLNLQGLAML
jgi:hypothetical protein